MVFRDRVNQRGGICGCSQQRHKNYCLSVKKSLTLQPREVLINGLFALCQGRRTAGGGSISKHIRPSHGASLTRAEGKKTINQCFPRCLAIVCSVYNRHSTLCSFRVRRTVLSDNPDSATRARIVIFLSAIIFLTLRVIMRHLFIVEYNRFSITNFAQEKKNLNQPV